MEKKKKKKSDSNSYFPSKSIPKEEEGYLEEQGPLGGVKSDVDVLRLDLEISLGLGGLARLFLLDLLGFVW